MEEFLPEGVKDLSSSYEIKIPEKSHMAEEFFNQWFTYQLPKMGFKISLCNVGENSTTIKHFLQIAFPPKLEQLVFHWSMKYSGEKIKIISATPYLNSFMSAFRKLSLGVELYYLEINDEALKSILSSACRISSVGFINCILDITEDADLSFITKSRTSCIQLNGSGYYNDWKTSPSRFVKFVRALSTSTGLKDSLKSFLMQGCYMEEGFIRDTLDEYGFKDVGILWYSYNDVPFWIKPLAPIKSKEEKKE